MKKAILPLLILFVLSGTIFSQGIYLRAGAGYGLPVATTQLGERYLHTYNYTNLNNPDTYTTEVVTGSYGSGMDFNFAVGYKFNANFIFDLNILYLAGKKYETSNIYTYNDGNITGTEESIYSTGAKGFMFNPSFIFSAGFGKAAPYGRFGIVASSPTITEDESYYYDLDGTSVSSITWVYKKGMGIGYQAAIGMNWKLTDKLDFYTEANFVSMTFYPTEGEMTENVRDGVDNLGNYTVSQKQKVFEKNYDPQAPYDPASPTVVARKAYPFSSVSAQIGVRFTIWNKAE